MTLLLACSDTHTYRQNVCFVFFPNLQFRRYKNGKITYPRNVACSSKQLLFPYQTVFFKSDNWRVYGVRLWTSYWQKSCNLVFPHHYSWCRWLIFLMVRFPIVVLGRMCNLTVSVLIIALSFEPRHDKMCLREFPTRPDTTRPAQPQKLARVLKCRL